jgi:hypothetical protein
MLVRQVLHEQVLLEPMLLDQMMQALILLEQISFITIGIRTIVI